MKISGVRPNPVPAQDNPVKQIIPVSKALSKPAQAQEVPKDINPQELSKAVDKLNKAMEIFQNNEVRFSIHEQTKHMMVQVIKEETGELIAEYPPKKILDLVAKLQEMVGLIVDKRV